MKKTKETRQLIKSLKSALVEKDVENAYRSSFDSLFPGCITSPDKCDGILRSEDISSLLEFKFRLHLRNSLEQAEVLSQVLYYLKKIEVRGEPFPKTIFVGDINECFCILTEVLIRYLDSDIDWNIAPSNAGKHNPELVARIAGDENVCPFVYDIDEHFDFLSIVEKMRNISLGRPCAVSISRTNIVEIFKRFEKDVVTDKKLTSGQVFQKDEEKRISELVDLFFTCLTSPQDAFLHPNKENLVIARGKEIKINSKNYRTFFSQFRQEYKPSELEEITANKDRILEDTYRRYTGAFFTPDIWVAEAHKMIAEAFGENWKEEYVVWDCAAGTANLTRGYKFKELYISTLEQSDIGTIIDCGYNPEATIFQYDFLDEAGIDRCPDNLKRAFAEGKKILFFINPPYGIASNRDETHKANIAKTVLNGKMKKDKMGFSSQQLYAQFIYKIKLLEANYHNVSLSLFAPPLFMTGSSFKQFRRGFYNYFSFKDGMLLRANNFADVKSQWGISFTIWKGTQCPISY